MQKNPFTKSNTLHNKRLGETKDRRDIPKHNKGNVQQAHANIQNWEKPKAVGLKSGIRQVSPLSPYLLIIVLEVLARAINNWRRSK